MADNVAITAGTGTTVSTEEVTTLNGSVVSAQHVQRIAAAIRTADGTAVDLPGSAADGLLVNLGSNNDVTVTSATLATAANQATELTTLASILTKLSADPATQTTLAAILAKIIAAPATEAKQDALHALIGEVQASPTSNTLLERLKAIQTALAGTLAVSGTFWQATQPVSAASLPLPTGASTESTLSTLNGKVPALGQAVAGSSVPVVLPAAQISTLTPPAAITGFATETTLAAQSAKLPAALGQTTKANSLSVALASDQDALPITDNGSSLTVDGAVAATQSGTWTAQIGNTPNTTPILASIHDGTTKASVADLTNSNPLHVAITDANGDQITSFGGGTEYTEGDTDASITGTAMLWEDGSDTLRAVSAVKPLPTGPGVIIPVVTSVAANNTDMIASTDVSNYRLLSFQPSGFGSATISVQGSNDNSTWVAIRGVNAAIGTAIGNMTAAGLYSFSLIGFQFVRVRTTGWASGTIAGNAVLSTAPFAPSDYNVFPSGNFNILGTITPADALSNPGNSVNSNALMSGYVGNGGWERFRNANKYVDVNAVAVGSIATVLTPTTGRKFRILGMSISVSAAATVLFEDNAAGAGNFIFRTPKLLADTPFHINMMGNGILSAVANNVLKATSSAAANLSGTIWYTEE